MRAPLLLALVSALPVVLASTAQDATVRPSTGNTDWIRSPDLSSNWNKENTTEPNVALQINVLEWVRANGGYFHPSQEFRRADPNDPSSHFGVFATDRIEQGEILVNVPWKCIVTAGTDTFDSEIYCDTTNLLIGELHKGDESFYGPYVKYLLSAPPVHLPSTWSQQGKDLFRAIIGKKKLPPKRATNWVTKYWKKDCNGSDDPFEIQAAMQLVSRGDDDKLTPIYDMFNHRNGVYLNTDGHLTKGQHHILKASRTIHKGEEIFLSYNQCTDCWNRYNTYGTPEIMRDYGFVEQYPQRWIFHRQYIAFDIDETENGDLKVTWLDDDVSQELDDLYEVSEWGIDILQSQLDRLEELNETTLQPLLLESGSDDDDEDDDELPQQELDSIMQYYNALTTALELAIEASEDYEYIVPYERDDDETANDKKQAKKKKKDKKKKQKKRFAPHVSHAIPPGEFSLLKWEDDESVIDPFAAQVGLPETLVPTIKTYANQLGIFELVKDFLYNDPCEPGSGRFYHLANPFAQPRQVETFPYSTNNDIDKEMQWYAQRPGSEWQSDMHWFAPSDERTHEVTLRMLFEGGFDQVLHAIGSHYDLDGLTIQSAGFLAVTHCEEGYLHTDFKHVEGKVFNFLIPLYSPEDAGPELKVVGNRYNEMEESEEQVGTNIKYDSKYGVLVGDGTWHGTRECDHRPTGDIRIVMSVYVADLTEDNLEKVSYDDTAIFPVPGMEDWLWAQRDRHWGNEMCRTGDLGRREFTAVDKSDECPALAAQGKCESKPKSIRKKCPRSCRIYMGDWEYQPGVERSEVIGDLGIVV